MRTLQYHSTNNGYCIVYYKDTDKLNRTLYGMQLETKRPALKFNLLVCSEDGEPWLYGVLRLDGSPSEGDQSTDRELNEFLAAGGAHE